MSELGPSRRAVLAGLGGLAVAGALAACGGSGTGAGSTGPKRDLRAWFHEYGEPTARAALARYAAEYPGGGVRISEFPGADYERIVTDALAAGGDGPDVFEFANGPTIDMITEGRVADLTGLLGDVRSDFTPALLDRMTHQGRVYGIPQVTDVQLLVYRPSLLAQAGVVPPRTLDELVSAARTLNAGEVKGLFLGNAAGVDVLGGVLLWSSGHDYLQPDRTPGFVDEEVAAGLRTMRNLFLSGALLLESPQDWSDPAPFIAGRTAMQWTGLWALPAIRAALGDDFGVRPFPAIGANGGTSVPFGAYGAAVNAHGDVERAREFVQWLWVRRTDLQLDWAQNHGLHVPARRSLLPQATELATGVFDEAADLVNTVGHPQTPLLWTPRCAQTYRDALDRTIRGGADPLTELRGVASVVEQELARFPR